MGFRKCVAFRRLRFLEKGKKIVFSKGMGLKYNTYVKIVLKIGKI